MLSGGVRPTWRGGRRDEAGGWDYLERHRRGVGRPHPEAAAAPFKVNQALWGIVPGRRRWQRLGGGCRWGSCRRRRGRRCRCLGGGGRGVGREGRRRGCWLSGAPAEALERAFVRLPQAGLHHQSLTQQSLIIRCRDSAAASLPGGLRPAVLGPEAGRMQRCTAFACCGASARVVEQGQHHRDRPVSRRGAP